MQSGFLKRLLASLALVSFTRADYYIDDQNYTSLLYSETPAGAKWGPFQEGRETLSITLANGTMMTVDASQCFNYTYTYAACTIADNCQVQIPFLGSGIAIYVLQAGAQGINASVTIDGGSPTYNVLPPPPGPNFYVPNVTLFSIQGITTGNHTATMTVQNWDNIFSGMMFDYAAINQTIVSPTTTASAASSTAASTTSSPTAAPPPHSTTNIGAIVGGVVGGLVALCALIAIFYFRRRRRHKPQRLSMDPNAEPKIEPFFSADSLYQQPATTTAGPYTDVSGRPTTDNLVTGAVSTLAPPQSTSSGSSRPEKSQLRITNPNQSASQIATGMTTGTWGGSSSTYAPGSSDTSAARIQQTHAMLSDDQADFVNNLYANNVPAGAIARVIERMMAGEREPAVDEYGSLPPPSYDHVG